MAIIRRAQVEGREAAGVRLDLGDLQRHADQIKQIAADQAERIVSEARAERERLIASAAEIGFNKGLAEGRAKGYPEGLATGKAEAAAQWAERLAKLEQSLAAALAQFEHDRDRLLFEARQDVLTLALLIAQKVTHRVLASDSQVVADQLAAALATISKPTSVIVAVHPDDERVASEVLPTLLKQISTAKHAELVVDPSLGHGSCVVRTAGGGVIDASVRTQLERIVDALAPAGPHGEPARLELANQPAATQPASQPRAETRGEGRNENRPDGGAVAA